MPVKKNHPPVQLITPSISDIYGKPSWGIVDIWDASFDSYKEERPLTKRAHIWASELDKAPVDIWLKMRAIQPTNPPDPRAMRKFEAGNVWEEILKGVLRRAGVFKSTQDHVKFQYPGLLEVTGKIDIVAGGQVDWETAKKNAEEIDWLPNRMLYTTKSLIQVLSEKYPDGLKQVIFEVKSVSSMMFNSIESKGEPLLRHALQAYHYLKATDMDESILVYIDRDSVRMMEFSIREHPSLEKIYKGRIETITKNHQLDTQPQLEKPIVVDENGRFSINVNVMYSDYLSMLYGYEHQEEFRQDYSKMLSRFNAVVKRKEEQKPMTALNQETIGVMRGMGIDI